MIGWEWKCGGMKKVSLYKFTHTLLLKNDAQLIQISDQQPKKKKKKFTSKPHCHAHDPRKSKKKRKKHLKLELVAKNKKLKLKSYGTNSMCPTIILVVGSRKKTPGPYYHFSLSSS